MTTFNTRTIAVTIDAPPASVAADLSNPLSHPEWATEFFAGPAAPTGVEGEVRVAVPMMGGAAKMKVDADPERGLVDLYLAPESAPYGAPLPVRLVPNGDGVDVLWTLAQQPGVPDEAFAAGIASMERELQALKRRHEQRER